MAKAKPADTSIETGFEAKSKEHASLIDRIAGLEDHLADVITSEFSHIEEDVRLEAQRLWKLTRQALRAMGVLPT